MITSGQFKFTDQGLSVQDRFEWIKSLRYETFKPEVNNEKVFEVDLNTRTITIPKNQSELGVQDDMSAEVFWFAVPRYFEGHDLAEENKKWLVHVYTANKDPEAREILLPIKYVETQKADENSKLSNIDFSATVSTANGSKRENTPGILLGWPITYDITKYPGNVSFALRCYEIGTEEGKNKDQIIFSLGTKPAVGKITQSYSFNTGAIPDESETVFPTKSIVMEMLEELQHLFGNDGIANVSYSSIGTDGMPFIEDVQLLPKTEVKLAKINNSSLVGETNFELTTTADFNLAKADIQTNKEALSAHSQNLSDLNAKIDRVQQEASSNLNTHITAANTQITLNTNSISSLNNDMGTVQSRLGDAERKISFAEGDILNLKEALGTEGGNGTSLTERVAANEEDIAEIQEMIGGGEGSEDSLVDRIESLENILGGGEGVDAPEGSLPAQVAANAAAITAIKDSAKLDSFADVEAALEEVGVKPEDRQAIIDEAVSKAVENEGVAGAISAIAAILAEAPEDLNTFAEVKAALDKVGVSEEDRINIVNKAVEDVFADSRYTVLSGKVGSIDALNEAINASETGLKPRVEVLESKIDLGDNENLKIQYEEAESLLYLFEGETLIKPDLENDIEGNVISTTTVTGGSGGGGTSVLNYNLLVKSSNPTTMFFADNEKVVLNFRAELTDNDAPEGEDNKVSGSINFKITLTETTSQTKKTISFKEQSNTDLTYDITKHLSVGTWSITMIATYSEVVDGLDAPYVKTARKTWSASIVNLSLTINDFNYNDIKTKDVNIGYTVKGDLNKTLYWSIDGGALQSRPNIAVFEYSDNLLIPMQSHGSHTVEIYAKGTKSGSTVEIETKPHTILDIMFVDPSSDMPVIRAVADSEAERQQYGLIPISFTVYQKEKDKVDITLTVMSDGEVESTSSRNVSTLAEQTWDYRPLTAGNKTLIIQCGEAKKQLELEIEEFPYAIAPVTTNLAFDFNPEGRTNEDAGFDIFEDRGVTWTVSENFDWSNGGWKTDEEGSSYFCIKAGTSVDFNYNLFEDTNTLGTSTKQGNGKEFKVVFKTANVADSRATWLSCLANTEKNKPTGIQMDIQNGYVSSDLNTLTIPYSEEDIIEFDMNIVPFGSSNEKNIPMIMTYEDGTPVQPIVLTDETASFTQAAPVPITIGSTDCDVHLYRMKAYSSFLSDKQILDNFIADARTGTEKADRYLRNQIYNALTGKLTPEDLANACPDLRIIKISAPRFTKGKPGGKWDKVKGTTIEMIYKNGREEDNWIATGCQHTGQGTSSNAYGQAGRNLDLIMKAKDGAVITIKDTNEVKKKVSLTEASVPVDYFNIKVNIASSENANNALLQKRFDRYLPYTPASHVHTPEAKTTMEFYNCVVFVQETGAEKVEFSDDAWHFYAIGNIGDSKKTDSSRASDPDDTNEFCVEIMDWNRALSSFPEDTKVKASTYIQKDDAGNITDYGFLVQDNLGKTEESAEPKLYEKQAGGYVLTQDVEIDLDNLDKYYVDILLNDDFSEDYTYGFRYLNDDEDPEQIAKAKAKWIEFYRFVTRDLTTNGVEDPAKIAAWKEEFSDWFIDDAAFFFYLFTLRYTMVDNRAKNTFWHYGKVATKNEAGELVYATDENGEFIYKFDFWDYDNDTSLGIDNAGKLEMDYGVEDNDKDLAAGNDEGSSPTYFRAANSTVFQRIIKYFANELPAKYAEYESAMSALFDSEHLIKEFDDWQSQFPEELWRLDYERKYKRPYVNGSGSNWDNAIAWADKDTRYLTDMMNGKKKYQRRQFERNQDFYMSSKFRGAKNTTDMITLRGAGDLSGADLVIPQDATLHIVPYLNMYVNLSINNTGSFYFTQKCKAGEMVEIPYPSDKFEFNYIYGSSRIQNLGDLSPMYLQTATLGRGEKLKEIILGNSTEGYKNNNIKDLSNSVSSNNKLLEILNIENLTGVSGSLPVQDIPSIKEIYAKGSGIESVTFARNGLIHKAELPESLSDLRLYDLYYLNDLSIEDYNSLLVFVCENTPNIDEKAIIENSPNLIRIRAIDIDWTGRRGLDNASLLMRLAGCKGIDANNQNTDLPVLTGKVEIGSIRQSEIQLFNELWPELELVYDELDIIPQFSINFYREVGDETPIYSILKDEMYTLTSEDDPSQMLINKGLLVKEMTPQYTYLFDSWTPDIEGVLVTQNLDFYGKFTPVIRQYTVKWYSDDDERTLLEEVKTNYGTSVAYSKERPSKNTAASDNKYHLFTGWDASTGYITGDINVHPVWETSTANISTDTASSDLSAIQLYALSKQTLNNGLAKFIADGAPIKLQTGYMPDYDGITLIESPVHFDGTSANVIKTDYKLFDEDKSFVLAIDFTTKYSSTAKDNTLMSCGGAGNIGRGIRLYAPYAASGAYAAASVQWNVDKSVNVSTQVATSARSYRDICVIRHKAGDPNLYVYTNNRFSMEAVKETVLTGVATSTIEHTLCFGAQSNATGALSNYGTGSINYAKLWFDDLGAEECKKICSWTKDELTFRRCGTEAYYIPDSENTAGMSFVAEQLLEEPIVFDGKKNEYKGGWDISDLRAWLKAKMFAGVSLEWQQLIQPVAVKSLFGSKNATNHSDGTTVSTVDEFYIPAYAEIYSDAALDSVYNKELSSAILYSPLDGADERKLTYPDGRPGFWWTRTPNKTAANKQIVVDKNGEVGRSTFFETQEDGSQLFYNYLKEEAHGVLLAFSIGEVK